MDLSTRCRGDIVVVLRRVFGSYRYFDLVRGATLANCDPFLPSQFGFNGFDCKNRGADFYLGFDYLT